MYDKLMALDLEAGTIIAWKEYNPVKQLWSKVRRNRLPYNKFLLISKKSKWLVSSRVPEEVNIFEPIKKYSDKEVSKLHIICKDYEYKKTWNIIVTLVNVVRPKTLSTCDSIDNNKYYKKVDWHEKLSEHIYCSE